jgi:hypothetical protein
MLSWIRRAALQAWRLLDAMAESPGPMIELLEHHEERIAHLQRRVERLESPPEA